VVRVGRAVRLGLAIMSVKGVNSCHSLAASSSMDEVRLSTRNNVISGLGERSAVPKYCPIKLPTSWQRSWKRGDSWQCKT
jgi:hypothetical protein